MASEREGRHKGEDKRENPSLCGDPGAVIKESSSSWLLQNKIPQTSRWKTRATSMFPDCVGWGFRWAQLDGSSLLCNVKDPSAGVFWRPRHSHVWYLGWNGSKAGLSGTGDQTTSGWPPVWPALPQDGGLRVMGPFPWLSGLQEQVFL